MTAVFSSLARYEPMWPSNALANMVSDLECPAPRILSVGYPEASLIFLTPSWPRFSDPETAAQTARQAGCSIVFVDSRSAEAFQTGLGETQGREIGTFEGFSLGRAEPVSITAWGFE